MNKKGQSGIIEVFFMFVIFIILWFAWLGNWLSQISEMSMATGNFTGIEAFFYSNLNLVVWVCLIIGMLVWSYFRSE